MTVTVRTFAGEKITIRKKSISEALGVLRAGGVSEDWIYDMEAQPDEATH